MTTALLWLPRVAIPLLAVATLLPLVRSGSWAIRIWDFPRVQLALLAAIPMAVALATALLGPHRRESIAWVVAALVIATWQLAHVAPFTPLAAARVPDAAPGARTLRVVVANVEFENQDRRAAADRLASLAADVLLVIECDASWSLALRPLRTSFAQRVEATRPDGRGMMLLSRMPVEDASVRALVTERRPSIHATLRLDDGRTIRFVGVHPTPPGLDDDTEGGRRDSRVRDAELVLLAREIAESDPEPRRAWIVAGDFNDVAWSSTTRLFARLSGLADPRIGRGLFNTYHADHPLLRYPIDHVMLSSGFTVARLGRERVPGSDHFAMVTDVALAAVEGVEPAPESGDRLRATELLEEGREDARARDGEAGTTEDVGDAD